MQCVWDKLVIKCEELGKISYLTANWQRCSAALLLHRNITTLKKVGNKLSQVSCRWILLISADWFIVIARTGIHIQHYYFQTFATLCETDPNPAWYKVTGATPLKKHESAWWLNFSPFGPFGQSPKRQHVPTFFWVHHLQKALQGSGAMYGGWVTFKGGGLGSLISSWWNKLFGHGTPPLWWGKSLS